MSTNALGAQFDFTGARATLQAPAGSGGDVRSAQRTLALKPAYEALNRSRTARQSGDPAAARRELARAGNERRVARGLRAS